MILAVTLNIFWRKASENRHDNRTIVMRSVVTCIGASLCDIHTILVAVVVLSLSEVVAVQKVTTGQDDGQLQNDEGHRHTRHVPHRSRHHVKQLRL